MSLPHFFLREQVLAFMSAPVFTLQLDADDMKHAKVLRLAAGEHARSFLSIVASFLYPLPRSFLRIRVLRLFLFKVWLRATRWILSLGMQPKLASPSLFPWLLREVS